MELNKGEQQMHSHVGEDGTVYTHTHEHSAFGEHVHDTAGKTVHEHSVSGEHVHVHGGADGHPHSHTHTHENTKAVLNRLSRVIGHIQSIRRMVEEGRDCSEVLIQLSAVRAAINNTGKVILQDHIEHCLVDAIESGDMQAVEELNKAIDRFIK